MNRFLSIFLVLFFVLINSLGCNEKDTPLEGQTLFRLRPADSTRIYFNNQIEENEDFNMVDYFYVYNGGGVAVGDINNDGLPDIYFTGNMVNDRLYLNKGDLKFEDISDSAGIAIPGWSTGVTMVDINHDGLLDIYVCRSGNYPKEKRKNLLYINNGNLTFSEKAEAFGIADSSYSTQAAFFDYDKDGDLDMYLLNHTNDIRDPNNVRPLKADGSGLANDHLYRNNGENRNVPQFTEVSQEAGILYDGFGLGLSIGDINDDGWEDIFVTNDFLANDYLYINEKNGTFKEMSKIYLDHVSHFSMGNDIADFNNDGLTDLITLDMLPRDNYHKKKMAGPLNYDLFMHTLQQGYLPQYMRNTLQLNNGSTINGNLSFSEIGQLSGVDATDWSWGPLFADFDNDGWKDLYITNGYLRDITDMDFINYTGSLSSTISSDSLDKTLRQKAKEMPSIKLPNFLFRNSGNLDFESVSEKWGLNQPSLSNGAAFVDLDNDGDLDLVTNNINMDAFVYENLSDTLLNHDFLEVRLIGDSLNVSALGAKVTLFCNGSSQMAQQNVTRGYQSSVDHRMHFGLGESSQIDSLSVRWPDGKMSFIYAPEPNILLTIRKDQIPGNSHQPVNYSRHAIFKEVTDEHNLHFEHQEKDYNDFNRQFLLPHKHSSQGPGIAVGDINGDGRDDFFMGGGYNNSGNFFYQDDNGAFKKVPLVRNEKDKYEEDTGVLFFDYDSDGDQDLYIVSGSNEFYEGSEYYQDRLYNNDGKGNFTLDTEALPKINSSGSCVRASDFDKDGDLDLFVGGRLTPLKYPLPPDSYLLVNQNGKFTDRTIQIAPALKRVGMVTDALWTDYDNDMDTDLIVVGEFMPIQFFKNTNGKLENVSNQTGLMHTAGWWNSINSGDFDNDGDIDYVLGNLGLNTKYKISPEEPLTIYALDYDKNGHIDPIMTYYIEHKEYPVHSRDDLIKQIPEMKKIFPDYTNYAQATISDILSKQEQSSSYITKAFHFASGYLKNMGNGHFELSNLPIEAQLAPVYGILVQDFDFDGFLDVLLSGNDHGTEVGTGRYDASKGTFLRGRGDGTFIPVPTIDSGLEINGASRGAVSIKIGDQLAYVFGTNSEPLKVYVTDYVANQGSFLDVPPNIAKAKITYKDGTERIHEFYYGSSYLSQSTRCLSLKGNEKEITMYDYAGKSTMIK